jgi:ATP synthase protein I
MDPEQPSSPVSVSRRDDASPRISLLGTASTMGLHMVSGPVVGGGLGWLADRWLDTWPWGAGAGVLLGIVAGFRNVWKDARWLIREQEKQGPDKGDGRAGR